MIEHGTALVRRARPETTWIDVTPLGASRPTLIEQWRGWRVELWCDWAWT